MVDPSKTPELQEAKELATRAASAVVNYKITTPVEYEDGATSLRKIKAAQKMVEDLRTKITKPLNAGLKAVNDLFRAPADSLNESERLVKREMLRYQDEQDRIRREEQRKADEAARKERERLEARAAKAADSGKVEKAVQLEQQAAAVVAPVVSREPPKVTGVSTREVWKFEVTDQNAVPREYLTVDESKIRKVVGALKGDTQIAGVRVWPEKQLAAGAA